MAPSRTLLRQPVFARLWFMQAATQVGGNMALYAMTVLVFATTRSNAAVSALVATYVVPQVLLSPFAGVLVDRLDVRLALIVPNIIRAIAMLGLALAGTNVTILLLLNLAISFTSVLLTPAEGAMIPRVVSKAQLETAMGIFNLTLQASFAVGFAFLGPLLVTLSGPSTVLAVVTVFYVAATIACISLPSAPPVESDDGKRSAAQPIRELRDGFAAVRHDREISRPIIHQAAAATVAGVLGVLGPGLATTIGLDPSQLVVIVLPLGLGVVGGVIGLRRFQGLPRRRAAEIGLMSFGALTTSIAVVVFGGSSMGIAGSALLPVVVVLAFISGAAYAVTSVSAQTALLESMPAEVRGRVFGVLASIVSASSLIPTLVAGPLADHTSPLLVIGIVGAAVFAIGLWSIRLFGPVHSGRRRSSKP